MRALKKRNRAINVFKNANLSYSVHTSSPWLHINNAILLIEKRAKDVVCQEFVRYLLADWSNPILHIHDDYCGSEVFVILRCLPSE